jgi:flagellar biosynthesis protein FlhB
MSERTHPATERQRQRFAERGETANSRDLTAVGSLVAGGAALAFSGVTASAALRTSISRFLGGLDTMSPAAAGHLFVATFCQAAGPTLAAAMAGALLFGFGQSRGHVGEKTLELDPSRLEPLSRLKQMFLSVDSLISLGTSLLKVTCVAAICGITLAQRVPTLVSQEPLSLFGILQSGGDLVLTLASRATLVMVALGLVDWGLTWLRLERKMRMSTQEVKDELREDLGDPQIRAQRRRRQRELMRQRSLKDVTRATVVLVNPTHYAVALRYVARRMGAPMVVAKGADFAAERIRAKARQVGVPVLSNPPLTRLLFRRVKVGGEIPADLYQAVAVVLAYVLRLRQRVA